MEAADYAADLIKKTVSIERIHDTPLVLHSDNGSPMKAATFQVLLEMLGIQSSYSRPRVSNDNPFSRRSNTARRFCMTDSLCLKRHGSGLLGSSTGIHTSISTAAFNFVTPEQRHTGVHLEVLKNRQEVYLQAKQKHSERWA